MHKKLSVFLVILYTIFIATGDTSQSLLSPPSINETLTREQKNKPPNISRRVFIKAVSLFTLGLLNIDEITAGFLTSDRHGYFVMPDSQMKQILIFLLSNRTKSGMPLSYRIPEGYWNTIDHSKDNISDITERLTMTYSLNIYDGACGQIAESILGNTSRADKHTQRLLSGRSGGLSDIRAQENFNFNGKRFGKIHNSGWFFRIISDTFFQKDPMDGKTLFEGFGEFNRLCHNDWKPIAGENAWAAIIGPLQTAYHKYKGRIPHNCDEVKLALSILDCTEAMQSPVGAIYYAPDGTHGAIYGNISNENNISMYAGLKMLLKVLETPENSKFHKNNISKIRKILYGEGVPHGGIEGYCREYMYNSSESVFYQGGYYDRGVFRSSNELAVDVATWGILVFGPELVDKWYGNGSSFTIWRKTKERAGYYDNSKVLRGIGYTDSDDISSAEWGFGAVLMLREMTEYYKESMPDYALEAMSDSLTLRNGIESELKTNLPGNQTAYLYANKRFRIPFGWWANPVPSLASTAWAVMVDKNFNPFILGGSDFKNAGKISSPKNLLSSN